MTYELVKLQEGVKVQYLAVYALNWRQEWGEPEVGFVEAEISSEENNAIQAEAGGIAEQEAMR